MASTIRFFLNAEHSGTDLIRGVGSKTTPYTYTTSTDIQGGSRILVLSGEQELVYSTSSPELTPSSSTMLILIPDVDGNFTWGSATGGPDSSLGWKAGVPLIFSTGKTTAYANTLDGRLAASAEFLTYVRFYNTGDSDGYVEVFAFK